MTTSARSVAYALDDEVPLGPRAGANLGLRVRSRVGLIKKIREGLPVTALDRLGVETGIAPSRLAELVGVPARTLARRRKEGRLQPGESDRLARLALLFDRAVELFEGDRDRAAQWFRSPKAALGGSAPLEYADTEPGAQELRDLMGRLEHGVLA